MPIRFRCVNCDGLLSIARRKAGTITRCPKCHTEVTVPDESTDLQHHDSEGDEADVEPVTSAVSQEPLKLDQPALVGGENPAQSITTGNTIELISEKGILLTPRTVTVLGLLFVVLLALSFATGLLLGN